MATVVAAVWLLARSPARAAPPANPCTVNPDTLDFEGEIVAPQKVKHVAPVYPDSAVGKGKSGTVVVELMLASDGVPVQATVKRGIDPDLDRAALEAVQQWEYSPAFIDGHPCPTIIDVSVNFELATPGPQLASVVMDTTESPLFARDECGISLARSIHEGDRLAHVRGADGVRGSGVAQVPEPHAAS